MREPTRYREEIEQLMAAFPAKNWLSIKDVANYFNVSVNTAKKRYPFIKREKGKAGCSIAELAWKLANES